LEDPRISRLYLAIVKGWFASLFGGAWMRRLMRSGMVTAMLLCGIVIGLGIIYQQHMRGNFHKLKQQISAERPDTPVPRPGGQEAIVLTRSRLPGGSVPEFLSVTLLPGRGMNVLQITAYLPDKGEVSLMDSPGIEDAERAMTGRDSDANGAASLAMGGAFEAPWAGSLFGAAAQGRVVTTWRGRTITLPPAGPGAQATAAQGGLLLMPAATSSDTGAMPDGGQAEANFEAGDFGAHWPSKTTLRVTVLLTSRSIELTMVAHNVGDVPEPIGLGWHPRFSIQGDREQMRLRIPGQMRAEVRDRASGMPTGVLLPVAGTAYDFTGHDGARLGKLDLDDSFVQLRQELLDSGPYAQLSDPVSNFGLRLTALTPNIRAMRVVAKPGADFVSIQPQFNYDDPFGREWGKEVNTGIVVVPPGQTTEWRVRLELVTLSGAQPPI
jgi:aldose 1-epimerase